jgi:hypothetical protein
MSRKIAIALCLSLAASACSGTFGGPVTRSTQISAGSRASASSIVPRDDQHRGVIEHLALAEEIYSKQLAALTDRRNTLRSRRRTLTLATYATFAATTLVIGAAAIQSSNDSSGEGMSDSDLRLAGFGALGGLGVGTTLEVVNLMQEDPSNVEAKIRSLQSAYDNMSERLSQLFLDVEQGATEVTPEEVETRAGPIIDSFINEALQINVKG